MKNNCCESMSKCTCENCECECTCTSKDEATCTCECKDCCTNNTCCEESTWCFKLKEGIYAFLLFHIKIIKYKYSN